MLSTGAAGLFVLGVTLACKGGGSSSGTSTKPQEPASSLATTKKDYAGDWEGGGVTLHIGDDNVDYEKKSGSTSTKYSGKLDHFDGDDIVIKILIANATLNVQSPPAEVGGEWKMTVENTEVTRKGSGGSGPSGKVETSIQSTMAGKGVALKKVSCPAVKPPFDCTVETGLGDTLTAHCVLSGTDIDWAINAAILDGHKLEGLIESTFLEQEKRAVDAQCPPGNLLKEVGSTFTCDAVDKKKGSKSTVNVRVEDKSGKVNISSK